MIFALHIAYLVAYIYGFYGLFLIYCTLRRAEANGKLQMAPIYVRVWTYTYLAFAITADALFNITLGALIFFETPWGHGLMFTKRCSLHRKDKDWRKAVADWFCDGWLNPFEADHC